MAQRGGKRPGAGRKRGSRDRATGKQIASISELARQHAVEAIETLVSVAKGGESEAAKVSAANAILDRGYGRPSQAIQHSGTIQVVNITSQHLDKLTDDELTRLEAAYPVLQKLGLVGGDPGAAAEAGG